MNLLHKTALLIALLALAACEQEGPAEEAGESLDEAVEDVSEAAGVAMARWILEVATKLWRVFHGEGRWEIERMPFS